MAQSRQTVPLIERMWRHIERQPDGCWRWTGALRPHGYGLVSIARDRVASSHRTMYELIVGPIPDGLQLDHLCRNRACCNPAHLEPVTPLVNIRRGSGNVTKTHCPQGHAYEGDNVRVYDGRRYCVVCNRERAKAWRAARKAAA